LELHVDVLYKNALPNDELDNNGAVKVKEEELIVAFKLYAKGKFVNLKDMVPLELRN